MNSSDRFAINSPSVIHEAIEGERIIINFDTGSYYSLNATGAEVWRWLAAGRTVSEIFGLYGANYLGDAGEHRRAIESFLGQLLSESLVVPNDEHRSGIGGSHVGPIDGAIDSDAKSSADPPKLEVYSDMQQLLLLDPIHEVDQTGWPVPKPVAE